MPPKGGSTRTTKDYKMPKTKSGSVDHRYVHPQPCKSNGTRDMRTTVSSKKT